MIRLVLIILVIYITYQLILKPFLRVLLQEAIRRAAEKQFGQAPEQHRKSKRAEGSIEVDYIPEKNAKNSGKKGDEGEYVDYEEIK